MYNTSKKKLTVFVDGKEIDIVGRNSYMWVKYADDNVGTNMSDTPTDTSLYLGIAENKETEIPSTTPSDYTWLKIGGQPGTDGFYTEFRFSQGGETLHPTLIPDVRIPPDWTTFIPECDKGYLWMTKAVIKPGGTWGTLVTNWDGPVRIQGLNGKDGANGTGGEGSITADFSDEMQSVACDSAGNVTSGLPLVAIFSMYHGSTPLTLDSITLGVVAGVTATANKNTGEVTVTAITASASDTLRIPVTGKGTYNGVQYERTIHLSVNKVRPGAPGENAVIYSLLPSVSVIKRNSAGQDDVANISCKVFKTDGVSTSEISSIPLGYELNYKIDSNPSVKCAPGYGQATSGITTKIEFILYKVEESYTRLDNETVYVVKDGIDGKDGVPVNYKTYVYQMSAGQPSPPVGDSINPGEPWHDYPNVDPPANIIWW
ncbi:MAG: hypothetical protein EOM35_06385 [Negativicutes bacterium]|nr:hypothetical protein [Negativicutes bacterium]